MSAATAPRLHAEALACRRGLRLLFKDLNLGVEPGQIVWLRGHNGRGKTSLLRLVAGLSSAEHGDVTADGLPVRKSADFRERLVFIGHHNALKDDLTVTEALQFLLRIHGRPSDLATAHAALAALDMGSRRNAFVRTLSQGQRRRVALARLAVEPAPSLWVLDEPFDALDVDGIARLNGLLEGHAARGGSVLLTSHLPLDTARLSPTEINLDAYAAAPR
ncbi:cytochrome c biogenesis heme-transporting ATPase CcmA [Piscinibacter terrae]|uniref:Cytochrome c biogenesis heme-transporting ATPase CcmA n=1 Tax=Piscinibacter terrae TaxID=2496871 RepID=A0A3N7HTE1_9BURK|nr:cytochrome c biogenesis heme-transporting ATPase CcmA [Albitalea terrae]RQP25504.1 cytochrome c biogenesis heme-transporting ATPase CcmA [Albitalea terrae]